MGPLGSVFAAKTLPCDLKDLYHDWVVVQGTLKTNPSAAHTLPNLQPPSGPLLPSAVELEICILKDPLKTSKAVQCGLCSQACVTLLEKACTNIESLCRGYTKYHPNPSIAIQPLNRFPALQSLTHPWMPSTMQLAYNAASIMKRHDNNLNSWTSTTGHYVIITRSRGSLTKLCSSMRHALRVLHFTCSKWKCFAR